MKTSKRLEVMFLKGVDQQVPPEDQSADNVTNFTVDRKTGGWDSRIGYEKFQTSAPVYGPFNDDSITYSNFVWSTQGGAIEHYMYERYVGTPASDTGTNQLCSVFGNPATETAYRVWRTPLQRRAADEPGAQYVPYGRYLIFLNGHDRPLKIDPMTGLMNRLGWSSIPAAPVPWQVDEADGGTAGAQGAPLIEYPAKVDVGGFQVYLEGSGRVDINPQEYGLGYGTIDKENAYRWKVSFISETGSESPLSEASVSVNWITTAGPTTSDYTAPGDPVVTQQKGIFGNSRHCVYLGELPKGPPGTVARRLYRTKNLGEQSTTAALTDDAIAAGSDGVFYYAFQVNNNDDTALVDYVSDAGLVTLAPLESDSILMPTAAPRFGASYMGRLFLDGGQNDPYRVYFSNPNQMDSFGALSFFDFGSQEGGTVTGLTVYNNQLVVFREKAIDLIRPAMDRLGFTSSPFIQGVGTRAPNSITTVPGVGVMFLSEDGVYAISGTNDGGSSLRIKRLSDQIFETIERITTSVISRSVAAYSRKWGEWHCYVPFDGKEMPAKGIVYHVEKETWSFRDGFPVGSIATDNDGNFIFGNHTGKPAGWSLGDNYEAGLFVISRKRIGGYTTPNTDPPTAVAKPPPKSIYKTAWLDFGYPNQKKFVKYIYLYVLTEGDNPLAMTYFKDYSLTGTTTVGRKLQRAEHADQPVYDSAIWGTTAWTKEMVTEIRYPVANEAVSHFAFELSTEEDIVLLGYAVEYETNKTQTAKGKTS
jgi:hypothetical protein